MLAWLMALVVGATLVVVQYVRRDARALAAAPVALLRGMTGALLTALALDAPAGRSRRVAPLVALDVSASWLRGGDSTTWRIGRDSAAVADDTVLLFGDSIRAASDVPSMPGDGGSRVAPVVDRALGTGRPLVVVTDGELTDPDALAALPGGSRVVVPARRPAVDAAVTTVTAPRAAVARDTVELQFTVASGGAGAPAATVRILVDDRVATTLPVDPLAPYTERVMAARIPLTASGPRAAPVVVAIDVPGDSERRNDSVAVTLEIAPAAAAVFVSTTPSPDARFALAALRGATSIPARGYYRVAPGAWRLESGLTAVAETEVRSAIRDAPIAILHGDTAIFGPPRTSTGGALGLIVAPVPDDGEWYVTGAPPSPLSSSLAGLPWDSLPPLVASATEPRADWVALTAQRGRAGDRRAVVTGWEGSRRVIVVSAAGFSGWRVRGGAPADAFTALWGSVFDWLAAGRTDRRAVVPDVAVLRAGDPLRWRRAATADSIVRIVIRRRAPQSRPDTVTLDFRAGAAVAETAPREPGIYDVDVPGGRAMLAVNASAEWLPRAPRVRSRTVRGTAPLAEAPGVRSWRWLFALALLLLCGEWLLRRRAGMR